MTGMREETYRELDERIQVRFTRRDTNFIYAKLGFSILFEFLSWQRWIWILIMVIDIDYSVASSWKEVLDRSSSHEYSRNAWQRAFSRQSRSVRLSDSSIRLILVFSFSLNLSVETNRSKESLSAYWTALSAESLTMLWDAPPLFNSDVVTTARSAWKKYRTIRSIFIIRVGCSSRKKRRVLRKDNAEDFAIRIKRDDGFTVLEWSFTVELARSV